jgi:peptide deformylase
VANPKFKSKSLRKDIIEEGCLSFPGLFFPVKRHKKVKVEAMDQAGEKIIIEAEGMLSRALQHEIDHLDGVLYIDRNKSYKKYQKNG